MQLFVYGTLKRGQSNFRMMSGARFAGEHCTEARYALYDLGGFPGVCEGGKRKICGELFTLPPALLARLDAFESSYGLARRVEIDTARGPAWMYVVDAAACAGKKRIASWD